MLRTGEQYLDSIRDGRIIYIGDERVDDARVEATVVKPAARRSRHRVS